MSRAKKKIELWTRFSERSFVVGGIMKLTYSLGDYFLDNNATRKWIGFSLFHIFLDKHFA